MIGLVCDLPLIHRVLVALPGPVLLLVILTGEDVDKLRILKTNLNRVLTPKQNKYVTCDSYQSKPILIPHSTNKIIFVPHVGDGVGVRGVLVEGASPHLLKVKEQHPCIQALEPTWPSYVAVWVLGFVEFEKCEVVRGLSYTTSYHFSGTESFKLSIHI